ncbi:hypothetical protein [Synechococcus sp. MIT S1220]|uniref:hypothetical protein n=1 Tax=Synechococcus sp. MIT S1220 TaxID=3082549 RepID=UPI0039B0E294
MTDIPLSDGMCGVTTPLPIPLSSRSKDYNHWWKNVHSYEDVVNYCWGDVIKKLRIKEKDGNDELLVEVKKGIDHEDDINLRFTSTMSTEVRGKKLDKFSLSNDITTDVPFSIALNVKKTISLDINSSPYVIGRQETRPMSIDVLTGKHERMFVFLASIDNDGEVQSNADIFYARSGVKLINSNIGLAYGKDQYTLEEGVKLKGRNFASLSPYTSDGVSAKIIPDGEIDTVNLPKKIKGGGELLVQGFGEEDILKLSGETISYNQLKDDKDIFPEWLQIENINYFSWMN